MGEEHELEISYSNARAGLVKFIISNAIEKNQFISIGRLTKKKEKKFNLILRNDLNSNLKFITKLTTCFDEKNGIKGTINFVESKQSKKLIEVSFFILD